MTEKSFRSQFKATPIKQLKKHVEDDNTLIGASNNEYLTLEDGKTTKIRMFPPHPGMEDFYVAKKCYWLSLSKCKRKILVFTDGLFYDKFKDEYIDYLNNIEILLYK